MKHSISPDFHEEKIGEYEAAGEEEVDTGPVVVYDGVDKLPAEVQEMEEEGEGVDPTAAAEEEEEEGEIAEGVGGIGIGSSTMNQVTGPVVVENAGADSGDPPWTAVLTVVVVVVVDCGRPRKLPAVEKEKIEVLGGDGRSRNGGSRLKNKVGVANCYASLQKETRDCTLCISFAILALSILSSNAF
ncbi:hypothetical protein KY284_023344 [Solanum tuberosum]|nr:hypothetical protein KY284_023344 [Solanum tuberosum]